MKVFIKNKIMSWGNGSSVTDETGKTVFEVKGKVFSITRKKFLCDAEGNRLFTVRNRWLNLFIHKAFIYDKDKKKIAAVKNKLFTARQEYYVLGCKDDIKIDGKFFSYTANILKNGEIAGTIRRQITLVADAFELEANEEDLAFFVSLVIAIDNICDKKHR